jgi:hypothetical protein
MRPYPGPAARHVMSRFRSTVEAKHGPVQGCGLPRMSLAISSHRSDDESRAHGRYCETGLEGRLVGRSRCPPAIDLHHRSVFAIRVTTRNEVPSTLHRTRPPCDVQCAPSLSPDQPRRAQACRTRRDERHRSGPSRLVGPCTGPRCHTRSARVQPSEHPDTMRRERPYSALRRETARSQIRPNTRRSRHPRPCPSPYSRDQCSGSTQTNITGNRERDDRQGMAVPRPLRSDVGVVAEPRRGLVRDHRPASHPPRRVHVGERPEREGSAIHHRLELPQAPLHLDQVPGADPRESQPETNFRDATLVSRVVSS